MSVYRAIPTRSQPLKVPVSIPADEVSTGADFKTDTQYRATYILTTVMFAECFRLMVSHEETDESFVRVVCFVIFSPTLPRRSAKHATQSD